MLYASQYEKVYMAMLDKGCKIEIKKCSLPLHLRFYYIAFVQLSSTRQIGMSINCIPWTAINDYAIRYSISDDEFETFYEYINCLDIKYLAIMDKRN